MVGFVGLVEFFIRIRLPSCQNKFKPKFSSFKRFVLLTVFLIRFIFLFLLGKEMFNLLLNWDLLVDYEKKIVEQNVRNYTLNLS